MAEDIRGFALEKAELLSSRLKEILSTGQGYIQARFGVDLGLKPELYPTWIILSTAAAGLLVLLGLSGGLPGKKRGYPAVSQGVGQPDKAVSAKSGRAEEQRKRNRKKTLDKVRGSTITTGQSKRVPPFIVVRNLFMPDKRIHSVKKSKKKPKTDVKPVQFTNDGKEPDDGAWETKVSNREKKQQRRKDKGGKDCGSPGGINFTLCTKIGESQKYLESQFVPPLSVPSVSSSRRDEPSVNGGGWTDISMKMRGMGAPKWDAIHTATHYRAPPKHQSWTQETQGTPTTSTSEHGMATVDPSSDWNAPVEHWGNYEEVVVIPAPPPKEQLAPNKVSPKLPKHPRDFFCQASLDKPYAKP
uniref:Uncharacterized protein n=1 Tax=Mola mola TaxID=94237 RepID=A0A3Q3XKS4_MOLML